MSDHTQIASLREIRELLQKASGEHFIPLEKALRHDLDELRAVFFGPEAEELHLRARLTLDNITRSGKECRMLTDKIDEKLRKLLISEGA